MAEQRINPYLEAAKAHYEGLGTKSITVTEWQVEGQPVTIYYRPITMKEKQKLAKKAMASDVDMFVDVVILKACTEDGQKMFTLEDRVALLNNVDGNLLEKLAAQLLEVPTVEDMEKN